MILLLLSKQLISFSSKINKLKCNGPLVFLSCNYQVQSYEKNHNDSVKNNIENIYKMNPILASRLPLKPIKPLNINDKIKRIQKDESFVKDLFIGKFDVEYLNYPHVLQGYDECYHIFKQKEIIEKYFTEVMNDDLFLHELGFYSLYKSSACVMISLLEAIGSSLILKRSNINQKEINNNGTEANKHKVFPTLDINVLHVIMQLITQNCLNFYTIENSSNRTLRDKLVNNSDSKFKIGFAWNEGDTTLGIDDFLEWETTATLSEDKKFWILSGYKDRIFKDNYQYYLVFCKTNIQNSVGIVGLLIPSSMMTSIKDEQVVNGLIFQRIKFENLKLSREEFEVIDSSEDAIISLNIRGLGMLGMSSVILGHLKTLFRECYEYLTTEKRNLIDCRQTQRILAEATNKIYALESCLYFTSQLYDSFKFESKTELNLESSIVKIIATEEAYEILRLLQQVFGPEIAYTSLYDTINIYDSFFDNSLHHRIKLGAIGMEYFEYYKSSKQYSIFEHLKTYYLKKQSINEKPFFLKDLKSYIPYILCEQSRYLEYCLYKFEVLTNKAYEECQSSVYYQHNFLELLSEIVIDIYKMTCAIARSSRAFTKHYQKNELELVATSCITYDAFHKFRYLYKLLQLSDQDKIISFLQEANIKRRGYSVMHPFDMHVRKIGKKLILRNDL